MKDSIDRFQFMAEGWKIIDQHMDPRCSARELCRLLAIALKASSVSLEYYGSGGYNWCESVQRVGVPICEGHWYVAFPQGKSHWFFDGGRIHETRFAPVVSLLTEQWLRSAQYHEVFQMKKRREPRSISIDTSWITVSSKSRKVSEQLSILCGTLKPVLLIGESGSGRTYLANLIHINGVDPFAPFSTKNLEDSSSSGTLYIPDWREMRQDKKVQCLNTSKRLIVATLPDRDTKSIIQTWRSETDNRGQVLEVPALRYRLEDLPLLAGHFLFLIAVSMGRRVPAISGTALKVLKTYVWPGNVRELIEAMNWMLVNMPADSTVIHAENLPPACRGIESHNKALSYDTLVRELRANNGNMTRTAISMGLTPRQFSLRLKKFGIDAKSYRSSHSRIIQS